MHIVGLVARYDVDVDQRHEARAVDAPETRTAHHASMPRQCRIGDVTTQCVDSVEIGNQIYSTFTVPSLAGATSTYFVR